MSLFSFFKPKAAKTTESVQEADLELVAPISGTILSLKDVPDLVISEKLVGDGIAIIPSSDKLLAPFDGMITRVLASNNAFAIRSDNNIEVYVTFGIGTNNFTGEGFTSNVSLGDKVKKGDPVINIDLNVATKDLESTATSMIVINSSADIAKVIGTSGKVQAGVTTCAWVILGLNKAE